MSVPVSECCSQYWWRTSEVSQAFAPANISETSVRPVPPVVERHNRNRPGVIVGAVVGAVTGAFIITFAVLWWRGIGCLDRKRPVTPSPPDSPRSSSQSSTRSPPRILGRVTHEEGWHNLSNPTLPRSSPGSCKSGAEELSRDKDNEKASGSSSSSPATVASPPEGERQPFYVKASSPVPPSSPPTENAWSISRPLSASSFRTASSSPVKEPYILASSEAARESRERATVQHGQPRHPGDGELNGKEDLTFDSGTGRHDISRAPSLTRKPSFTMLLKNSSKGSLVGGYISTHKRLGDQGDEVETRDWTRGMKPLDVDSP